ncbi:hypothetical protein [Motiliproteus sp. SC1-56]|uniref:LuxE/PaaK family acyltransferase n=1 Tax=Motiliproteus sp. SC1-56 TaxID=2799565 RepID=UPI001A8D6915|nr:hypothetical protein [Motiliproteus sp. SC1-56]
MDALTAEREALAAAIGARIEAGINGDAAAFEPLALRLFAYQYRANDPFREYCDARGVTPENVDRWEQIPAFPTNAFKDTLVTSFPQEEAVMAQLTSGTTANKRGQIFRDAQGRELVFAANRVMTEAYLFPDLKAREAAGKPRCRVLILAPSPQMAPSMGMAMGMEETRVRFGADNSRFLLERSGIDIKGMVEALTEAERSGQPVAFIGATGAFVYFFQACQKRGLSFRLPEGSRIGDGGGYRGRFGEMDRNQYYRMAEEILRIQADHCINVLGMAESATNYFENPLHDRTHGLRPGPRRMIPPPWTRTQVVDPHTLEPLPAGEVGLLRHFDLANLPTVLGVQSDNLGVALEDGSFRIIGRAQVEDGKVSLLPAERTVGPMGDNRIFRFLENYVNFSIRFKMGLLSLGKRQPRAPAPVPNPTANGPARSPEADMETMGADCPCGEGIEQLVEQGQNGDKEREKPSGSS